jgi:hypothetical protein
MEFFNTDGNLFSEVVTVGGGEVYDSGFGFKCKCRQPVSLLAVYVVFRAFL